ncbi:MAG TPA: hypothetical protein VGE39_15510 [Prosthecobacter sp.]
MQQIWSIRSRAHECALTGRPFEDGEVFHTAIYFDPQENGYVRRDVAREAWKDEQAQRKPVAAWKTVYQKVLAEAKAEIAPKESAMELLQRFIEDGDPLTENARYILALMLERKRQISQTAEKEVEGNKMLFYENKKTGQIFIVRDPELKLDEVAQIQEEVATILAFGGPAAEAAKAAGVTLTPHGVVPAADADAPTQEAPAETAPPQEADADNNDPAAASEDTETTDAVGGVEPEDPDTDAEPEAEPALDDDTATEAEPHRESEAQEAPAPEDEPAVDEPEQPHDDKQAP